MRRPPRRITPGFVIACAVAGLFLTFFAAGPAHFLHAWLGDPGGKPDAARRVDTPSSEFGPWEISRSTSRFSETWTLLYPGEYETMADWKDVLTASPPAWVHNADQADYEARETPYSIATTGYGWPFRSFRCIFWEAQQHPPGVAPAKSTIQYVPQLEHAWRPLAVRRGRYHVNLIIPTSAIWSGLLADTAFWGFACASVTLGFSNIRANRRRRKGLCARCGYAQTGIAADAPCPECGSSA